jgi:hypothetical protein
MCIIYRPIASAEVGRMTLNRHQRRAAAAQERRTGHANGHERAAYTVAEFCWAHGFSRATYYNLKARGLGPDELHVLGRIIITNESALRWRKRAAARTTEI